MKKKTKKKKEQHSVTAEALEALNASTEGRVAAKPPRSKRKEKRCSEEAASADPEPERDRKGRAKKERCEPQEETAGNSDQATSTPRPGSGVGSALVQFAHLSLPPMKHGAKAFVGGAGGGNGQFSGGPSARRSGGCGGPAAYDRVTAVTDIGKRWKLSSCTQGIYGRFYGGGGHSDAKWEVF